MMVLTNSQKADLRSPISLNNSENFKINESKPPKTKRGFSIKELVGNGEDGCTANGTSEVHHSKPNSTNEIHHPKPTLPIRTESHIPNTLFTTLYASGDYAHQHHNYIENYSNNLSSFISHPPRESGVDSLGLAYTRFPVISSYDHIQSHMRPPLPLWLSRRSLEPSYQDVWFMNGHMRKIHGADPAYLFHPLRKPKGIRTAFSPSQLIQLEHAFEKNHYVVGSERRELAQNLSLSETQVKVWFQNRRTKHKRQKQDDLGCELKGKDYYESRGETSSSEDEVPLEMSSPSDVKHSVIQSASSKLNVSSVWSPVSCTNSVVPSSTMSSKEASCYQR